MTPEGGVPASCAGDLKLDQLRVNQLRLCRQLSGSLEVGPGGVRLHARGLRPDEVREHRRPRHLHAVLLSTLCGVHLCVA